MAIASISMLRHHSTSIAAIASVPAFGNVLRRCFNVRCLSVVAKQHNPNNVSNKPPPSKNLLRAKHTFKNYSSLAPVLSPQDIPPLSESQAIGTVAAAQANFMRVIVQSLPSRLSVSSNNDSELSGSSEGDSSDSSRLGIELLCVVKAVLKKIKRRVLVGDKVVVGSIDWVDRRGMIENVFQRSSEILDPPVANVDHLLVLFSIDQPKLEPFTLTRFLVEAESTGIPLTLGLNKLELVDEETVVSWKSRLRSWGYDPLFCSVQTRIGLDSLAYILRDQTTVIVGPSGVGKSSLINALRSNNRAADAVEGDNWFDPIRDSKWFEDQRVAEVSTRSGRGKHTTRHVSLLHKYKEKQDFHDILSDEGATKVLKTKNRKEKELDYSRPLKKVRADSLDMIDEDQISVHSGSVVKVDPTSSTGFPSASGGTNKSKSMDHSSKDSKYNMNVIHRAPNDKRDDKLLGAVGDDYLGGGSGSTKSNSKKRKVKASSDVQTNPGSLNGSEHLPRKRGPVTSDNDHRKEKKAKLYKPPGKESSGRKEKKGSHSKNWLPLGQDVGSSLSHRSLDGADSLKRDLGAIQPSLVATSSSSKISGSHKTKSSFHEMKGSPVESVSSSPMRIPNRDKILRSSREGKDFLDAGRTRFSDEEEEDGGSDRSGTGSKKKSVVAHCRPLKSPSIHTLNKDASNMSGKKAKTKKSSSDVLNCDLPNGSLGGIDPQHPCKSWAEQVQNEDRPNGTRYRGNVTYPVKSGKDLPSQSKDMNGSYCSDVGMHKDKVPYSHDDLRGRSHPHSDLKVKNGKHKLHDNSRIKSGDARKESSGKLSIERGKRDGDLNFVKHEGPDSTVDGTSKENVILSAMKNQKHDRNGTASKKSLFQKKDQLEKVSGKNTPVQLPTSGELRNEIPHCPPSAGGGKGSATDILQIDASESKDVLKGKKHAKNHQKEAQTNGSRHSTPNERMPIDAPSPARRDSSNQAATKAMKEAKDLKHLADRFKNTGSNHESLGFYFQAALKFLYGASLLELSNNETAKQSMQIYSSTAKLCEFCAHEYEKIKDMAAAALAYKCMEVAFMRVIYSSHNTAIRDQNELQKALKLLPSGESPSPASDVDNLNNPGTADKVALSKGVSSSQANGSHVIPANNRPDFVRLLGYAQNVNFAMEASRKSQIAFTAANSSSVGTTNKDGISCIKTALDFNFQDVEGLLALVRIAMEAINR